MNAIECGICGGYLNKPVKAVELLNIWQNVSPKTRTFYWNEACNIVLKCIKEARNKDRKIQMDENVDEKEDSKDEQSENEYEYTKDDKDKGDKDGDEDENKDGEVGKGNGYGMDGDEAAKENGGEDELEDEERHTGLETACEGRPLDNQLLAGKYTKIKKTLPKQTEELKRKPFC